MNGTRQVSVKQVTWVGLILNLALSAIKFFAGTLGHSRAVVADAVHSLSDLTTDIAVLAGASVWDRPPDACHPYGHRRIETMVALFVGAVLALAGLGLGWNALNAFRTPATQPPGNVALFAAILSIVLKEGLYRWTLHCGKQISSIALTANAHHHRSDALSSFPTALAVAAAHLGPAWYFLDAVGAIVVSLFILYSAWKIMWPGIMELSDFAAPESIQHRILEIAEAIPEVREVHNIRTRYVAARLQIDLHVLVDPDMSVARGHEISSQVQTQLIEKGPDVFDVVVQLEPYDSRHTKRD